MNLKNFPLSAGQTSRFALIFLVFCSLNFCPHAAIAEPDTEVHIGVLAKRGEAITLQRWGETAAYLESYPELRDFRFSIIPLTFEAVEGAVVNREVDFVLANSGIYVYLEHYYGAKRIATLKNRALGNTVTTFGSVIFTQRDRDDIQSLDDFRGKSFAAVNETSLGGWIMAKREFVNDNIEPEDDFESLSYLGTHDAVVEAVIAGEFDGGSVRTDTIERMVEENKIDLHGLKVIPGPCCRKSELTKNTTFPFAVSSQLYPEWPLAQMSHTPDDLAEKVASALFAMHPSDSAAIKGKVMGWTIPHNYQSVREIYHQLKLPPYDSFGQITLLDVFRKYGPIILGAFFVFTLVTATLAYILRLYRKLRVSEKALAHSAAHDALTNLPNRCFFENFASRVLAAERRRNGFFRGVIAVFFIDLDDFKPVNDQYGHSVGDSLLVSVAERLESRVRESDMVARMGGDEFVGFFPGVSSVAEARKLGERLISEISATHFVQSQEIRIGVSLGVSIFPNDGDDIQLLLRKADQALYQAKSEGKGGVHLFDANSEAPLPESRYANCPTRKRQSKKGKATTSAGAVITNPLHTSVSRS